MVFESTLDSTFAMQRCKIRELAVCAALAAVLFGCSSSNSEGASGTGGTHGGRSRRRRHRWKQPRHRRPFGRPFRPTRRSARSSPPSKRRAARPPLLFNHDTDGQLLLVRIPVPKSDIVTDPSGGAYVDVDIGSVTRATDAGIMAR